MTPIPLKKAKLRDPLLKKFSDPAHRLTYVLLLSGDKGDAVSWAMETFSPEDGFHFLRKASSLCVEFPTDTASICKFLTPKQAQQLTVYSDRLTYPVSMTFPAFSSIAAVSEQVRCFYLCRRLRNRRMVADVMGWRDDEVRRVYESVNKRLKALKGAL